ncbi:mobilization protein [Lachnospiraceae bacterium 46-61]
MNKNLDKQGRWRNKTVSFRMSKEEVTLLDNLVALSGLAKQDYIIKRLLYKDVVVVGNTRVYKALKNHMEQIFTELKRLSTMQEIDDVTLLTIQFIGQILKGMKEENQ